MNKCLYRITSQCIGKEHAWWGGRKIYPGVTAWRPLWICNKNMKFSAPSSGLSTPYFVFFVLLLHLLFKIFTWLIGKQTIPEKQKSATGNWLVSYKQYWFGCTCITVCNKSQHTLNHSDIFYSSLQLDMGTRELALIRLLPKVTQIHSSSIFGKCLSVHVFLTFCNLGMAHESVHTIH